MTTKTTYIQRYYQLNKDKIREKMKEYRKKNKKIFALASKRYYEKHREEIIKKKREQRQKEYERKYAYLLEKGYKREFLDKFTKHMIGRLYNNEKRKN